jgi:hypothetical protein
MVSMATPDDRVPSTRYSFEPEFTGPPPRLIPDRLDEGPYPREQRTRALLLFAFGFLCLLLSRAPGVDVLALYVLPLGYLSWIGLLALAGGAAAYIPLALRRGPFRYVRDGLPLAVRVLDLVKGPRVIINGQPSTHGFVATVAFRHPDTGEVEVVAVKSNEFSSSRKDAYDTPFKVGDDVTAVYLPGRLEKSLRLYSFLELSPDVNLRMASTARPPSSPWRIVGVLLAVCGLLLVAFANVYAFGRYEPVTFDLRRGLVPFAAGAVVIGGGVFAALYLSHRQEQLRIRERAIVAQAAGKAIELEQPFLGHGLYGGILRVLLAAGSLLLGGVTAVCWCFMANAWLDRSPARAVPATIVGMAMTTHAFLFREYELEYRLEGSAEKHELLTTPQHLLSLGEREAVARVREGRLGWPWVETVTTP